MNKIYSCREIEKACRMDINFMWLLDGQKVPDNNTIARFKSQCLTNVIEDLFYQLVLNLGQAKKIKFEKITTPKGNQKRMNCSIHVEGAFGVLKEDYGFSRFLMCSKKMFAQSFLLFIGYVNKLHNKRCGILLHEKIIA